MLQGAAQRGAQFYFIFPVLRTLFSCRKMSLLFSNSVLTLYGLILAPLLNLFELPFLVLGSELLI